MPAYHSAYENEELNCRLVGNFPLFSFQTSFKGPSYPPTNPDEPDIIDEVLQLFRPNSFFRNFEIKNNADRVLIYGILYVSQCLSVLSRQTNKASATRVLNNLSLDDFSLPGDPSFPLNAVYAPPRDRIEYNLLKSYLNQFRQEASSRLIAVLYAKDENVPDKFWLALSKRKFMNKSL